MTKKIFLLLLIAALAPLAFIYFQFRHSNSGSGPKTASLKPPLNKNEEEFPPIFGTVVNHGREDEPKVALSFDADMTFGMKQNLEKGLTGSYYNEKVIEILRREKVPATLFLSGLWVEAYPEATWDLSQDPLFEIGNHSYSHPTFAWPCFHLKPISEGEKEREISRAQEIIFKKTGRYPRLFRFPGGCYKKSDLLLTQKNGLTTVHWNVDGRDAFNTNEKQILSAVKKETKPGSILIFHLNGNKNAPLTAVALPEVIKILREKGYRFVKVSDLLRSLNPS